jgi:transposase
MIRSRTVNTIHELATQGQSIHTIAATLGLARNTVRKYLRTPGERLSQPRRKRGSKLDPFKVQIQEWISCDHLYNCETMLPRLQALGYTGKLSVLRAFVHPLRPPAAGHQPVQRYETAPGEQMQFDWAEFRYEREGVLHKLYGFIAILSYSRMRFVTFVKRCDTPTMIRCLMEAFEYFGGLPKAALTDRMKSVFLEELEGHQPRWNPVFSDFMASIGVAPRVCKPRKPQTKGKVERSVGVVKTSFWPGVTFSDLEDLNRQALAWCQQINGRVHRTTLAVPLERWAQEHLAPLPTDFAWERFGAEERKVSWDGYLSYDGVRYGLPAQAAVAGSVVQVRERAGQLRVFSGGQLILQVTKRPRSQQIIPHPDQFLQVPPTLPLGQPATPVGHQVAPPVVALRSLWEYDRLFGVEVAR